MSKIFKGVASCMGVAFTVLWIALFLFWFFALIAWIMGFPIEEEILQRSSGAFGIWLIFSIVIVAFGAMGEL